MGELIVQSGNPLLSGATVMDGGVNFTVYSKNATRVVIYFFDRDDAVQPSESYEFDPVTNKTGDLWHCFVQGKGEGTLYLYRVDGPYVPPEGHRFNFVKYLLVEVLTVNSSNVVSLENTHLFSLLLFRYGNILP